MSAPAAQGVWWHAAGTQGMLVACTVGGAAGIAVSAAGGAMSTALPAQGARRHAGGMRRVMPCLRPACSCGMRVQVQWRGAPACRGGSAVGWHATGRARLGPTNLRTKKLIKTSHSKPIRTPPPVPNVPHPALPTPYGALGQLDFATVCGTRDGAEQERCWTSRHGVAAGRFLIPTVGQLLATTAYGRETCLVTARAQELLAQVQAGNRS